MKIKNNQLKTIKQLQNHPELTLLTDFQDTDDLRERFPGYDSFFIKIENGDYSQIWGFVGTIPYLSKLVAKLVWEGLYDDAEN